MNSDKHSSVESGTACSSSCTSECMLEDEDYENAGYYSAYRSYRPRGSLARVLFEKELADRDLCNTEKFQWYQCDLRQIRGDIAERFVQLHMDKETEEFLERSKEKSNWLYTQLWYALAKAFLGWFMTQTSVNGWLRRGSMFVLSLSQFRTLLGVDETWRTQSIVDLGAGDGEVTACLAPAFEEVYVTEVSGTMQSVLREKGYRLLDIDHWNKVGKYDVISCLNVLDRCGRPLTLLNQIKESVRPGSRILIAIVLPFTSYVETGSPDHQPAERLAIKGCTFEEQVNSLVEDVFIPAGFVLERWTKVPYLCEGDLMRSFYWLNDAIFILKVADDPDSAFSDAV